MAHVGDHKCAILNAKVRVSKVRQDSHDLVLMSKRSYERAHGLAAPEIMKQLEFILNSKRATCHVDFLKSNISRLLSLAGYGMLSFILQSPALGRTT